MIHDLKDDFRLYFGVDIDKWATRFDVTHEEFNTLTDKEKASIKTKWEQILNLIFSKWTGNKLESMRKLKDGEVKRQIVNNSPYIVIMTKIN